MHTPQFSPNSNTKNTVPVAIGGRGLQVCIFCSANDLPAKYTRPAQEFARLLAEHGHNLVWGGSDTGLMREVAASAQQGGAKLIGISVEFLKAVARPNIDELVIAKDLGERKATMLARSDVLVTLVGGIGTLDEITEIAELKKHKQHHKPIIVLNTDHFYDGLKLQLETMEKGGFLPMPLKELISFFAKPKTAIDFIDNFRVTTGR